MVLSSLTAHLGVMDAAFLGLLARLVLPIAMLAGAAPRRRRSSGSAEDSTPIRDEPEPIPTEMPDTEAPVRLSTKELRLRVAAGEDLGGIDLHGADLRGTDLTGRDLCGVDLTRARLRGARLGGACLIGAKLVFADLSDADLAGADLSGARLLEADLTRADLSGADLSAAHSLELAALGRARYTKETHWPVGFDPAASGAVLLRRPPRQH